MASNKCYTHTSVAAKGKCSYCNANYCGPCLFYIGTDDALICENCHSSLSSKFLTSMLKRKKYIYVGYIILIFTGYIIYQNYGSAAGNTAIILFIFISFLILLTRNRINGMKYFLNVRSFQS